MPNFRWLLFSGLGFPRLFDPLPNFRWRLLSALGFFFGSSRSAPVCRTPSRCSIAPSRSKRDRSLAENFQRVFRDTVGPQELHGCGMSVPEGRRTTWMRGGVLSWSARNCDKLSRTAAASFAGLSEAFLQMLGLLLPLRSQLRCPANVSMRGFSSRRRLSGKYFFLEYEEFEAQVFNLRSQNVKLQTFVLTHRSREACKVAFVCVLQCKFALEGIS